MIYIDQNIAIDTRLNHVILTTGGKEKGTVRDRQTDRKKKRKRNRLLLCLK